MMGNPWPAGLTRRFDKKESSAFVWMEFNCGVDGGERLRVLREHFRKDRYVHFLSVQWRITGKRYRYGFRVDMESKAQEIHKVLRELRGDQVKDFSLGSKINNGGEMSWVLKGYLVRDDQLGYLTDEKIDALVAGSGVGVEDEGGDVVPTGTSGSGAGGGGGSSLSSSQTVITSSPTNQPAAAAIAGSPPAASASSEAGMTPQDTTPRPSPCTTPGTTQRQRLKQPSQSDSQFARSGSGARSFLALPSQAHDSSVQAFGGGGAGGGGAGGLTSGSDSSREPEGDRTDGSSAKKAKTTHHRATSACAGQAEERVAGMGSSLQSQASTLTYVDQPEPGEPELFPLAVHDLDMQTSPPFDDWDRARALALPLLCGDDWYGVAPELAANAAIKAITTFLRDHLEVDCLRVR